MKHRKGNKNWKDPVTTEDEPQQIVGHHSKLLLPRGAGSERPRDNSAFHFVHEMITMFVQFVINRCSTRLYQLSERMCRYFGALVSCCETMKFLILLFFLFLLLQTKRIMQAEPTVAETRANFRVSFESVQQFWHKSASERQSNFSIYRARNVIKSGKKIF